NWKSTGTVFIYTEDLLLRVELVEAPSAYGASPGFVDPAGPTRITFVPRKTLAGLEFRFPAWRSTRYSNHDELIEWRHDVELVATYDALPTQVVLRPREIERFDAVYTALLADFLSE